MSAEQDVSDRVIEALEACLADARLVPMQRIIGAGHAIQNVTVVALPVERWEELVEALSEERRHWRA